MEKFNGLSEEQEEILTIMMEECAEIIQTIAKIKRHGYSSYHPDGAETNRDALIREMGDFIAIKAIWAKSQPDIDMIIEALEHYGNRKLEKLPAWTHHIDWSKYGTLRK